MFTIINKPSCVTKTLRNHVVRFQFCVGLILLFISSVLSAQVTPTTTANYVTEYVVSKPGVATSAQAKALSVGEVNVKINYFDGLGRPLQSIDAQTSPMKKDIVMPFAYDEFGREKKKYLPFVSGESNGALKPNPVFPVDGSNDPQSLHEKFYDNGLADKVVDDTHPFSETVFESSPLNRPLKSYGPGAAWAPDGGNKFVEHQYLINSHGTGTGQEKIIAWKVDTDGMPKRESVLTGYIVTGGYYANGQLQIKVTIDEQGNAVREYTDKQGRVVLKKVQADVQTGLNDFNAWALTYYIYDNLGNLRFVLQPELSKTMHGSESAVPLSPALAAFAFQYKYDTRNRMISKQVPGAEPVFMIYDDRDRLVLTQDGEQREDNEWMFTKYDALNRPVITGITINSGDASAVQTEVNSFYALPLASGRSWFDTYSLTGNFFGYDNLSYPQVTSSSSFLTVTYYDKYDNLIVPTGYTPSNQGLPGEVTGNQNMIRGQLTATLVKNLVTNDWMRTVNYYDDKYRIIQSVSNHQKGTVRVSNVYDFPGKLLYTKRTYSVEIGSGTYENTSIRETFTYDHAGRLLLTKHSINGADDVVVSANYYNELGQLVAKGLHSEFDPPVDEAIGRVGTTHAANIVRPAYNAAETELIATNSVKLTAGFTAPAGSTFNARIGFTQEEAMTRLVPEFRQVIDYRYNIRGWMTRINNANINVLADGNTVLDHFGMQLAYEQTDQGLTITPQYNGNISATVWSRGAGTLNDKQAYTYTYDKMNRLKNASHFDQVVANTTWVTNNNAYGESIGNYDLNGNILQLTRKGKTGSSLDNLTYGYAASNQLLYVHDNGGDQTAGFVNGNTGVDDYAYDANGNLKKDKNKGLVSDGDISYNHLNLPKEVIKGTERIIYGYDATGKKLFQEVYKNNVREKRTDYIGELIYESKPTMALQLINHTEGRCIPTDQGWDYQYHLKDHLGNVRLTFSTEDVVETETATVETSALATEQERFLRYEFVKRVHSPIFDRTKGTALGSSVRLTGNEDADGIDKYGLAKSLSVMPGDVISAEVYVKYLDPNDATWTAAVENLMSAIASGSTSVVTAGENFGSGTMSHAGLLSRTSTAAVPAGYLNWVVFDRNYQMIESLSGYRRMSAVAREYGQDVAHEKLYSPEIVIKEPGYVYIYFSNEPSIPEEKFEVYFDDFKVTHTQVPIVQMDDYYPFGLTYNSYARENSIFNKYQFNGKELQNELDLGWNDFGARMYMSDIGRWGVIDPLSEKGRRWSSYNYAFNNPIRFIDPDGMWPSGPIGDFIGGLYDGAKNKVVNTVNNVYNAVTNPVATAKSLTVMDVANSTILAPLNITKGNISKAINGVTALASGDMKTVGNIVGETAVDATVILATEGAGRAIQSLKGASAAEGEMTTVYRGVNENHLGYNAAVEGSAVPRGGNATAAEHNAGNTQSNFTSWTTDPEVATNYALRPQGGGVVLSATVPKSNLVGSPSSKDVVLKQSGKLVNEQEVLRSGTTSGATVKNINP